MRETVYHRVIEKLYEAALDAEALKAMAGTVARTFEAGNGFLAFVDMGGLKDAVPPVWTLHPPKTWRIQ